MEVQRCKRAVLWWSHYQHPRLCRIWLLVRHSPHAAMCSLILTLTYVLDSFWSYESCQRWLVRWTNRAERSPLDILFSGGIAGVVTWASIYPLDVIKTILQAQPWNTGLNTTSAQMHEPSSTIEVARRLHQKDGFKAFYRGLGVCSARAFVVNAVQVGRKLGCLV